MRSSVAIRILIGLVMLAAPPLADPAAAQACTAGITATDAGITALDPNPRLFVSGNFKDGDARNPFRDLAYVSTQKVDAVDRHVLSVLLSNGDGCFFKPTPPAGTTVRPIVVGEAPQLMTSGDFNDDGISDLAVVDAHLDRLNPSPKVRIWLGTTRGFFKPSPGLDVVPLGEGEKPVAIALGRFRTAEKPPLDLAIVSVPPPGGAARGVLRILFNSGSGEFSSASPAIPLGNFEPAAMAAGVFRTTGKVDLVIKEVTSAAGRSRLLYLQNAGNATFPTREAIDGAGDVPAIVLGPLESRDASGPVADVITFDKDMTLRIFASDGQGHLNPRPPMNDSRRFGFVGAPEFFAFHTEGQPLQLVAAAARSGNPGARGMLVLTSDEGGHFEEPPKFREVRRFAVSGLNGSTTREPIADRPALLEPRKRTTVVERAIAARFLNDRFGNQKPDLAFAAFDQETEDRAGPCVAGRGPRPSSRGRGSGAGGRLPAGVSCRREGGLPIKCIDGPFCADTPVNGQCLCTCDPASPEPADVEGACRVKTTFPPVVVVLGNPFDK